MVDMALHQILPAALRYSRDLCEGVKSKKELGLPCRAESALLHRLSDSCDRLYESITALQEILAHVPGGTAAAADYHRNTVVPVMNTLREYADILEAITDKSYWPYPTYSDILFY